MRKFFLRLLTAAALVSLLSGTARAAETLIPVGRVVGLELLSDTVTVAAFEENSPGEAAGLQVGDRIVSIDGKAVTATDDVRALLNSSQGAVRITVSRGDTVTTLRAEPAITPEGPKLGVYLRQGVTGIGTVTWYDPDTETFGALGHGVNDSAGDLLRLQKGNVYPARVASVRQGRPGEPGQLMGTLTQPEPLGTLEKNTQQGVFGKAFAPFSGEAIPVAQASEIRCGSATILSTVQGSAPQEYSVEILKLYPTPTRTGRNLLLRITDPQLLQATHGIVQGMSGSPIIQDGKLVGAVTHVLVNDPTTGYGIFIENMLDAAA